MTTRIPLPYGDPAHLAAHQFLVEEAALLDAADYPGWLDLLTEDIRYVMPVRVTTARGAPVSNGMGHFDEDLYALRKRVQRLATDHAWTEDPPSRTRHFVTNVRTFRPERTQDGPADAGTRAGDEGALAVQSAHQGSSGPCGVTRSLLKNSWSCQVSASSSSGQSRIWWPEAGTEMRSRTPLRVGTGSTTTSLNSLPSLISVTRTPPGSGCAGRPRRR